MAQWLNHKQQGNIPFNKLMELLDMGMKLSKKQGIHTKYYPSDKDKRKRRLMQKMARRANRH